MITAICTHEASADAYPPVASSHFRVLILFSHSLYCCCRCRCRRRFRCYCRFGLAMHLTLSVFNFYTWYLQVHSIFLHVASCIKFLCAGTRFDPFMPHLYATHNCKLMLVVAVAVAAAIFAMWCETILFSPNEQMTVILFNDMTKRTDLK